MMNLPNSWSLAEASGVAWIDVVDVGACWAIEWFKVGLVTHAL